uniref:Plexin b2a, tandem duplicate 1 n=1 Tax=Lates calcarifer TaxID=8187 RepID=A0A4W6CZU6_LATCA
MRWWAWQFTLVTLATIYPNPSHGKNAEFLSATLINNLVADPRTGRLYVGAVNALYQLSPDLKVESHTETGPKRDNRQCTPPVTDTCEEAVDTDNHNKLLLVHGTKDVLVVCGSIFRGICSLRNLSNVEQLLYFSDSKGEKSYVASAEESVSVVGVMSYFTKDKDNFTVGKGYGSHDSTKLISTRILQDYGDWVVFDSIIEASAVQANPFVLRYLHDFRFAFKDGGFVYFLFSRTLGVQDTKNFTFISRMCENDHGYYSYTELQLNCSATNKYNKAQVMIMHFSRQVQTVFSLLFVGMYPLRSINKRLVEIIGACYSYNGIINEKHDMVTTYNCGAEFLPSPLASKAEFALTSDPSLARKGHMTAVAVAVEMGHAVAFLGTTNGEVLKVHLSAHPEVYGKVLGELNKARHLCVQITKVPVQACHLKTDCHSCIAMKDPYCGWCVLEGKCTTRQDCSRWTEENTWLWSPNQQCVQIQAFDPPNLSCKKTQQVQESDGGGGCDMPTHTKLMESSFQTNLKLNEITSLFLKEDCVIYNTSASVSPPVIKPGSCPQFESPEPLLIPVGFQIPISFEGRNLALTSLPPSPLLLLLPVSPTVVLYNCSVGREDCSLCKHADAKYQCVWCATSRTCVYRELCPSQQSAQCPNPEITDIVPRFGPLKGRISVTIKGSNMGIKKEDIKKITVAGVDCNHQADRYSVSTRPVYQHYQYGGGASSDLGGTLGNEPNVTKLSLISVEPMKGPMAGGTVITIRGEDLDTGTKDDVTVTIGGVTCEVLSFGINITCKTGKFRAPSDPLTVTVKYGADTTKDIQTAYQYTENPKVIDYNPKASFVCKFHSSSCLSQFIQDTLSKNDTVLQFYSPSVNSSFNTQSLRTSLQLDNVYEELKNFDYHPDPSFNNPGSVEFTSLFLVSKQGRGFSKAMTAKEAQAFVGDASCHVNILQVNTQIYTVKIDLISVSLQIKFGHGEWVVGSVYYARKDDIPLAIIIPAVIVPMLLFIAISVYCYRRKSQQAEREYEKVKHQLENLEESVRDRCKKEFTDLMIEMEDHTSDLSEARIPFLDYKTYTDRNFFLPSKDGANDTMITGKIQIPEARRAIVAQALNQFSNLLNSKTFLINFIRTLESRPDFNARARGYFASLLTVALHGKLEYYTDIMRTLLLELMDEHVQSKNPKLMLRRSETVVERMLCNWMSICLYQFLRDTAGEPLYKLFKALKHQVEKGPVDAKMKKAKYTLNDTGLLGDDVEYSVLTLQVLVHGEGPDVTPVKVLNCDTITQVKEKIIDQVYRNLPYSQRPKVESVALEWRPGSTGQILSDLDLTSQKEGRWKRLNTLAHYNVRDNATLVLSRVLHTQSFHQHQDSHEEKNALLEDDNTFHLVRPADEIDEVKSKRGSMKDKAMTKAITEIYLTRLLSVKGTLQQFVDDFFRSVLCSSSVVPPAVKYFFDFLDEQALRHDNVDEETLHIWKTNSLPLRFWVNILRNPHFIFDVHVTEVVDASLHVISQTFMDACTKTEHKLSRESPSNKLLYAKEISTYKKMVDDYYKGIRQMVPVSDQDMNTHLAEVSRQHTDKLNTQVALHQLYQYASKYYDVIIQSLDEDPAAQNKQLTLRLQQIAAALENKVTDL